MMKAFEHTGFWWDPRDPGTRWPGTLKFDPVAGATLARTIGFHPRQIFGEIQEFDILHGETTGGTPISLLHCFERSSSDIFANAVIAGFHADRPDPLIRVAAAVIENLNEWWGQRALAHEPGLTFPNVGLRYMQPEPVVLHDHGTLRTAVHSSPLASFERTRGSIEEEMRIELKAADPQPLNLFRKRIHACQDLLSVASLTLCNVEELRLVPAAEGERETVASFYAVPVFKNPEEGWPHFLFRYNDIGSRARDVFGAWLGNADSLSAVRSLYMSGAYGKSFLELKFLALAQAAEACHRRLYEGNDRYMDAGEYERSILPGLLEAIPKTLDASHRQALSNRLRFGNEFSFRKRLTMLFEEHAGALGAVVPSPASWIERLVGYRNDFTHHPVVDERTDLDKEELVQCNFVLRILLELCFLKAMAFESKDIERLAKACHRYGQIKARFFREA